MSATLNIGSPMFTEGSWGGGGGGMCEFEIDRYITALTVALNSNEIHQSFDHVPEEGQIRIKSTSIHVSFAFTDDWCL